MKRVLVTGATGGLGRNAVGMLIEQGVAVRATGRNAAVGETLSAQGAEYVAMDLANATASQAARLMQGVDAVWHCAALSSPWGAESHFVAANVTATHTLLDAAGRIGVPRFIHVSTPAIYFDYENRFDVPEDFQPKRFVNAYARTKAQAEACVQQAVARFPQMRSVILRPRAIFGRYDQVLMPRLAKVISTRRGRLPLPRGGRAMLDVTYAENVVHAMWLATIRPHIPSGEAFNITNHEPTKLCDVLQRLFVDELQRPLRIIELPYPLLAVVTEGMQALARLTGKEPRLTR